MKTWRTAVSRPVARRALSALALAVPVLLAPACEHGPAPFLWRIEADPPSYLFGTMHVSDPRVTAMPDIVQRCFQASNVLVTEIPLDQPADAAALMASGRSLHELLPDNLYRRVSAYFGPHPAVMRSVDPLRIWAVILRILENERQALHSGGDVLDYTLWRQAVKQGKQRGGLASVEEQLSVFDQFTTEEQRAMLAGTLDLLDRQVKTGENLFEQMVEIYCRGDADELRRWSLQSSGVAGDAELERKFVRVVIDDRNRQMADRIDAWLRAGRGKSHFFAAGAMHFAGPGSIPALLREKGYRITRL